MAATRPKLQKTPATASPLTPKSATHAPTPETPTPETPAPDAPAPEAPEPLKAKLLQMRRPPAPRPVYLAFAKRLRGAMLDQGMSASDLARAVWGTSTDNRGYQVAKNRDRIGHYLAGVSYPEAVNLRKIEAALGLSPDALALTQTENRAARVHAGREARGTADLVLTAVNGHPGVFVLQARRMVTADVALQILKLLNEDTLPPELDSAQTETLQSTPVST